MLPNSPPPPGLETNSPSLHGTQGGSISQDLTVFNITKEAVVARQAVIDPSHWPVVGPSNEQGPPMSPPLQPPAWWADALITD
jgi:ribonuclease Z